MLLPENFITAPIESFIAKEPWPLSVDNIVELAQQLNDYVDATTSEALLDSNTLYWISVGLHNAVKQASPTAIKQIGNVMYKLATRDPTALLLMLRKPNEFGYFKGQNTLFVWLGELYTATFNAKNTMAIITLNLVLSHLLEHPTVDLAQLLVKNNEIGVERGKNGLLLLTQAILRSASFPHNQSETLLITHLLEKCLSIYPDITTPVLTQEINQGSFKDKTIVYMLVRALQDPAKDNQAVVNIICNILIDIIKSHKKEDLVQSLFNIIGVGPHKESHPLYIMLRGLLSAAYVDKNDQVISNITSVLDQLYHAAPEEMNNALAITITQDYEGTKNGITMLVETLLAAFSHDIETVAIDALLSTLINSDSEIIARAFTQQMIQSGETHKSSSPLELLVNKLNVDANIHNIERLMSIMTELTASKYAVPMILSLPLSARAIFIDEFSKAHHPKEEMLKWLSETERDGFDPLAVFDESAVKAGILPTTGSGFRL